VDFKQHKIFVDQNMASSPFFTRDDWVTKTVWCSGSSLMGGVHQQTIRKFNGIVVMNDGYDGMIEFNDIPVVGGFSPPL